MDFHEINRYCNPRSLLVISPQGRLKRIYCPFQVQCIEAASGLTEFGLYSATSVKMSTSGTIVYVVDGEHYPYYHFAICAL
jgi:hypothetical protein